MTPKQYTILILLASSSAIELTPGNFLEETDGKNVFLKFYSPRCPHCKSMQPAWDKLTKDFAGSETQLVAEIDCSSSGRELCEEFDIQGYPTLKYGDPTMDLEDYQGRRGYDELKKFADENLKAVCSVKNIHLCDEETQAQIKKYQGMGIEALQSEVGTVEERIADAEEAFAVNVQKLQKQYEILSAEKDEVIANEKSAGLGLMKSVLKQQRAAFAVKDEL